MVVNFFTYISSMRKERHIMSIGREEVLRIERSVSRDLEIVSGLRQCHHRVHKSAKTYTRKEKHKLQY
jgi:hypothetical protein